jgi:hypothetical protein
MMMECAFSEASFKYYLNKFQGLKYYVMKYLMWHIYEITFKFETR